MNLCLTLCLILVIILVLETLFELKNYDEEWNKILTSQQLRGSYNEEKNTFIKNMVNILYNSIYLQIIESAKNKKNKFDFTIMCKPSQDCTKYNGYEEWLKNNDANQYINDNIIKYNIKHDLINTLLINKIKKIFPDSNFTTYHKNCCNINHISW